MPRGPQGQLRPDSPTSCAILVMKIATGEVAEGYEKSVPARAAGGVVA